jgi:hypothetical protein
MALIDDDETEEVAVEPAIQSLWIIGRTDQ